MYYLVFNTKGNNKMKWQKKIGKKGVKHLREMSVTTLTEAKAMFAKQKEMRTEEPKN